MKMNPMNKYVYLDRDEPTWTDFYEFIASYPDLLRESWGNGDYMCFFKFMMGIPFALMLMSIAVMFLYLTPQLLTLVQLKY